MPLTSRMLRDSQALQDCLVRDSAHLTQGVSGAHVTLVHKCLLLLEPSRIDPAEIRSRHYGPTTAAAVLAYKTKRQIINPAYQSRPDNIVGKMTIARLDRDMLRIEATPTHCERCGMTGGEGFAATDVSGIAVAGSDATRSGIAVGAPVQHHRLLTIQLQQTDSASIFLVEPFATRLLARARELMRPHGLTLVESQLSIAPPIPWPDSTVDTRFSPDRLALRKAAVNALPEDPGVLRIIFVPFVDVDPINGITEGGLAADEHVQKFVLINLLHNRRNPDAGTLLHEMVHASFPGKSPEHDGVPSSVYSIETARTELRKEHAAQLANAFFARSIR